MQNGDHEVRTAWGFLAVRLPLPEDKQWAADRATILQALGVLDPDGKPTALVATVKAADVARLTQEDWQGERDKMLKTCNQCHSGNFAKQQLDAGDDMIKNADHLMAEAIQIVAGLYKDGVLAQPKNYAYPFPEPADLPRCAHGDRAEALRDVPGAPHAHVSGDVSRKSGLRALVRMERNAARLDRDPGIGGADAAGEEDRANGKTSGSETGQRQEISNPK